MRLCSIPEEKSSAAKPCLTCQQACGKIRKCKDCKSGCYCSKACRDSHVSCKSHQIICESIQQLEELEKSKRVLSVRAASQVSPEIRRRLVSLVGEKPLVSCRLNGKGCDALWDTGAMVSMVCKAWLEIFHPNQEIMSLIDFVEGDDLTLCTANNTKVAVEGIAVMNVEIGNSSVPVPFVVCGDDLTQPIIGYNVIKHMVFLSGDESSGLLRMSCPSLSESGAKAVVNLLRSESMEDLAITTKKTIVPPNSYCRVKCKTKYRTSEPNQCVLVSPNLFGTELELTESIANVQLGRGSVHVVVSNPTNSPIVLQKGILLASIEAVSAVIPILSGEPTTAQGNTTSVNSMVAGIEHIPHTQKNSECYFQESKQGMLHLSDSKQGDTQRNQPNKSDWLPPVDLSHLSDEQRTIAEAILREEAEVFCRDKEDQGDVPDMQMDIHLTDNIPVVVPHRQIPRPLYEEVKNFLNDLIVNNWIRESKSDYSSPIVCVRKKDSTLRMCIDYRSLNQKIIADKQPIPRIQEILDGLGGQEWFSTLDMAKAYHQGYVKEEFRKLTAFSTPWGLYEWIRIPMGISNAPPVFQRYINRVLQGLRDIICTAYLDDILVYGSSFEEQARNLKTVLARLRSRGLKLRADKCLLFRTEVRYLGRLVSRNGHKPDPADSAAIEKFREPPKTIGDLRSKLGFLGYYRSYVRDFSRKFQPMYQLLQGNSAVAGNKKSNTSFSKKPIQWTVEMQRVVDEVIDYLKSPEFLAFPDYSIPFVLNVDASSKGLGAVLYQKQGGKNRTISFGSRTLNAAEQKYHLHSGKLEFLALKWAITTKFSDYLCFGPPFTVYTDNNPLTYVMTTAKLDATGLRWVADLARYQFRIKYKPGKHNNDADALSRCPLELDSLEQMCTEEVKLEDLDEVLSVASLDSEPTTCSTDVSVNLLELQGKNKKTITREEIREAQQNDNIIAPVVKFVEEGRKPTKADKASLTRKSVVMLHQFSKLAIEDGMLVRKMKSRTQIVMPSEYHPLIFNELHTKMGHLGPEKVEELSRQRFYWPYMKADIEDFIQHRCTCVASKQPPLPERAPLIPMVVTAPFEMVSIDFLHLDRCQGYEYVLLVTDQFTRFAQAYATRKKDSLSAANKLYKEFIPQFGFPKCIHSDLGEEFNSSLFTELHRLSGIRMSTTTPYHPQGNGAVERLNRTLINMLRSIPEDQKNRWKDHLSNLMFAYNSTVHKSTGYSPFFLVFGRESRLPIDTIMPLEPFKTTKKSYDKFVKDWKNSLKEAYQIANQHQQTSAAANKNRYDKRVKGVAIEVGDKVLVRNLTPRGGTGKLRSWWEHKIYAVVHKRNLVPVYTIRPIDGGKCRTVHRNLLMKVDDLPGDIFGQKESPPEPVRAKPLKPVKQPVKANPTAPTVNSDSESSDSYIVAIRRPAVAPRDNALLARENQSLITFSADSMDNVPVDTAALPHNAPIDRVRENGLQNVPEMQEAERADPGAEERFILGLDQNDMDNEDGELDGDPGDRDGRMNDPVDRDGSMNDEIVDPGVLEFQDVEQPEDVSGEDQLEAGGIEDIPCERRAPPGEPLEVISSDGRNDGEEIESEGRNNPGAEEHEGSIYSWVENFERDSLDEVQGGMDEEPSAQDGVLISIEGEEGETEGDNLEAVGMQCTSNEPEVFPSEMEQLDKGEMGISRPGGNGEVHDSHPMDHPFYSHNLEDEDIFLEQGERIYDGDVDSDLEFDNPEGTRGSLPGLGSSGAAEEVRYGVNEPENNLVPTDVAYGQSGQGANGPAQMESTDTMADSVTESDEDKELVRPPLRRSKRVRQGRKILTYPVKGDPKIQRYPFLFNLEVLQNHTSHS